MIDEYYSKLVADPLWFLLWTVFCSGVGFFVGHWGALIRDRRIEFNAAADRLFPLIHRELDGPNPFDDFVSPEAEIFGRHLTWRSRRKFDRILERYRVARGGWQTHPTRGSAYYPDDTELKNILRELREFTKRR